MKNHEGIFVLTDKDHLSIAGFRIATGIEPQRLSEVYREVSTAPIQLTPESISEVSRTVIAEYDKNHPKE